MNFCYCSFWFIATFHVNCPEKYVTVFTFHTTITLFLLIIFYLGIVRGSGSLSDAMWCAITKYVMPGLCQEFGTKRTLSFESRIFVKCWQMTTSNLVFLLYSKLFLFLFILNMNFLFFFGVIEVDTICEWCKTEKDYEKSKIK